MICSTIIPTIGRNTLEKTVRSVLEQDFDPAAFEVIVVNDSGLPLAHAAWMDSAQVRLIDTNRHNRSVARNTGAALAKGQYLHFLDDDDWMLPGTFRSLSQAASEAGTPGWVYGGFRLVNDDGEVIQDFQPNQVGNCFIQLMAAEWIPLQASWINRQAFFSVGGFAHLHTLGGGFEDIDLSRLIASRYHFTKAHQVVAAIRYGDRSSTTNYAGFMRQNRLSREKNLELPGAFWRMLASASADRIQTGYWQGRILYFYLASLAWNLKQKQLSKVISRLAYSFFSLVLSIPYLLRTAFWRGVLRPHHNLVRTALSQQDHEIYSSTVWER